MTSQSIDGIIKTQRKTREIKIMKNYTINIYWYNEIKDLIKCENVYIYGEDKGWYCGQYVELDVDEAEFIHYSRKLGWM